MLQPLPHKRLGQLPDLPSVLRALLALPGPRVLQRLPPLPPPLLPLAVRWLVGWAGRLVPSLSRPPWSELTVL